MLEDLVPKMKTRAKLLQMIDHLRKPEAEITRNDQQPGYSQDTSKPDENVSQEEIGSLKEWPVIYKLPNFPPFIEEGLTNSDVRFKHPKKNLLRNGLMQILYDDMSQYVVYPKATHYYTVLTTLVKKYPLLKDSSISGIETMKKSLINKFKKERINLTSLEAVIQAKRKFGCEGRGRKRKDSPDESLQKLKRRSSLQLDENEDEHSIANHLRALKNEYAKPRPNIEIICDSMRRSVQARKIQAEGMETRQILQEFPFMVLPQCLLLEMKLQYGVHLDDKMQEHLPKLAEKIMAKEEAKKNQHFKVIEEQLQEDAKQKLKTAAAVLLLPSLFNEKEALMYSLEKEAESCVTPTILLRGGEGCVLKSTRASLAMDGMNIIEEAEMDIPYAVSLLFASYFVYNIKYPKNLKHTLQFLEHYIFSMPQTEKKDPSVPVLRMLNYLT